MTKKKFLKKKIAIFLQNRRESKKRHTLNTRNAKNDHHALLCFALLCFARASRLAFLVKLCEKLGRNDSLRLLSLFFSSLAVRKVAHHREENTVRRAHIIIRIRLYHHITQREHL